MGKSSKNGLSITGFMTIPELCRMPSMHVDPTIGASSMYELKRLTQEVPT